MTRADICMAACEGLTDDQVRALVTAGGLVHLAETVAATDGVKLEALVESLRTFPAQLAALRGNVQRMRSLLIQTLAEIDGA